MGYTRQNFKDGQVLTAEHLNNMERGIESASVQTDWDQTDETAADFLKNKPFGDEPIVLFDGDIAFEAGEGAITVQTVPSIGSNATVIWDGVEYVCHVSDYNGVAFIGNGAPVGLDPTEDPFAFAFVNAEMVLAVCLEDKESVSVKISGAKVNKLDTKYIKAATMFYVNIDDDTDIYLYTDIGMTTKATAGEVRTALQSTAVILTAAETVFLTVEEAIATGQYVIVSANSSIRPNNLEYIFYTAEYVPES